jgi:hypothetical protein
MHQDELAFGDDRGDTVLAFAQGLAVEHHRRPVGLGCLHLHEGRGCRHHDGGGNVEALGMIGDGLGVIACRHRNHAAPALVLGESGELDEGASVLERVGNLKVLVFDVDLGAG